MEYNVNKLWLKFWYVTILPGALGLLITIAGLGLANAGKEGDPISVTAGILLTIGIGLVAAQAIALLHWYFGTVSSPSHWMIIRISGEMIGFCKPKRFMCPQYKDKLAIIDNSVRLKFQGIYGKRGKDLDTSEEVGSELGAVEYFAMDGDKTSLGFDPEDARNVSLDAAYPEVGIHFLIIDPIKVRSNEIRDPKTDECKSSGAKVVTGQLAESVREAYQGAITGPLPGKSIAWVAFHKNEVRQEIKNRLINGPLLGGPHHNELTPRGLCIEDHTLPTIPDYGETEDIKKKIAEINDAILAGKAKIEKARQNARAAIDEAKAAVTAAKGQAETIELLAKASGSRIKEMKEAGMSAAAIAKIFQQEAVRSGLPANIRDLFVNQMPELYKEVGADNKKVDKEAKPETKGAKS